MIMNHHPHGDHALTTAPPMTNNPIGLQAENRVSQFF